MNKNIEKTIEELTKDCSQEDKEIIVQIVGSGEPGAERKDLTEEQIERILPILEKVLAAISEEVERLERSIKVVKPGRPTKDLNGYTIMADSYRKAAKQGNLSKKEAEKVARSYDFLAKCDEEDICNLFDSCAFNEIAKSYMRLAVKELVEEGTIDEEQGRAVRNRFSLLFSEKKASEVL